MLMQKTGFRTTNAWLVALPITARNHTSHCISCSFTNNSFINYAQLFVFLALPVVLHHLTLCQCQCVDLHSTLTSRPPNALGVLVKCKQRCLSQAPESSILCTCRTLLRVPNRVFLHSDDHGYLLVPWTSTSIYGPRYFTVSGHVSQNSLYLHLHNPSWLSKQLRSNQKHFCFIRPMGLDYCSRFKMKKRMLQFLEPNWHVCVIRYYANNSLVHLLLWNLWKHDSDLQVSSTFYCYFIALCTYFIHFIHHFGVWQ